MSGSQPVLVLTNAEDVTADAVVAELNAHRVPVFRCDTAEFPQALGLSARLGTDGWHGEVEGAHRSLDLTTVRSVYYRRPTEFVPVPGTSAEQEFAINEARAGFLGVVASLPCLWVNHPAREAAANYKPYQLRMAAELGLHPPDSIITNNPDSARKFAAGLDRPLLYKALGPSVTDDDGKRKAAPPALIDPSEIDDAVRLTAHLFQEFLDKDFDVRLTVVGTGMFAAKITAGTAEAAIDWRSDYASLSYDRIEVPPDVARKVLALMGGLDLVFGALDFTVTRQGDWRFLEVNPNGQWHWIQHYTDLPIAEAIAELLTRGRPT